MATTPTTRRRALRLAAAGLLCAVPFGLAVRDELGATRAASPSVASNPLLDVPLPPRSAEPPARPAADDNDALDGDRDDTDREPARPPLPPAALDQLFGATAASPGPLFDGIELGASSQDFLPEAARRRIQAFRIGHGVGIDFDFDERELLGFRFTAPDPAGLRAALTARWGAPLGDGSDDAVWLGTGGRRLTLTAVADRADLIWSRYQTVAELIAPGDPSRLGVEPFPLLGARLARVSTALGSRLEASPDYGDQHRWRSPGLPTSDTDTVTTLVVERGVVVEVVVATTGRHGDDLRRALVAKYGPPADSDGTPWTTAHWTGARTVDARVDDAEARIAVRR